MMPPPSRPEQQAVRPWPVATTEIAGEGVQGIRASGPITTISPMCERSKSTAAVHRVVLGRDRSSSVPASAAAKSVKLAPASRVAGAG
jgi:hypothetical protein